ncbi:MAG: hypothetical protein AW07_02386 [Candidatus Accumulibacter sp. SK-11]|nr:MAG: hypothetical protein AW07_02386 [Candidatus Accumulibacter sp. SK-11]
MNISSCSTRPVQEPQLALALVCLRTSSSVNRPFSLIALQIVPLVTPLQPQTSASSGITAALLWPSWPLSPMLSSPNISLSRMSPMGRPARSSLKYQLPSAVSPNMQAPTSLSFWMTSFL